MLMTKAPQVLKKSYKHSEYGYQQISTKNLHLERQMTMTVELLKNLVHPAQLVRHDRHQTLQKSRNTRSPHQD